MQRYQFEGTIQLGVYNQHMITLPLEIGLALYSQGLRRVLCLLNGKHHHHCALYKLKDGGFAVFLGASSMRAFDLHRNATVRVDIGEDTTPYQAPMPEELAEVLKTDPEADSIFHELTPGRQRSIIYYISSLRRTDGRIDRALAVAERLKQGITDPGKW